MSDKRARPKSFSSAGWEHRGVPGFMACFRCMGNVPVAFSLCGWGQCDAVYCSRCRRYLGGAGPSSCPCLWLAARAAGYWGHRTKAEQPRKPAPHRALYGRRRGHR